MTQMEEEAIDLAKVVLKLEKGGYIDATGGTDDDELECEHLRRIAIHHARKIQTIANKREKAEQ